MKGRVEEEAPDLPPNTKTTSRLYAVRTGVLSVLSSHGSFRLEENEEEEIGLGVRE